MIHPATIWEFDKVSPRVTFDKIFEKTGISKVKGRTAGEGALCNKLNHKEDPQIVEITVAYKIHKRATVGIFIILLTVSTGPSTTRQVKRRGTTAVTDIQVISAILPPTLYFFE